MARKTIEHRLAQLDAQRVNLKARLSKQECANDAEFTKRLGDWLRRELTGFLTRPVDSELFANLLVNIPETNVSVGASKWQPINIERVEIAPVTDNNLLHLNGGIGRLLRSCEVVETIG